jgi:hypothetical protein
MDAFQRAAPGFALQEKKDKNGRGHREKNVVGHLPLGVQLTTLCSPTRLQPRILMGLPPQAFTNLGATVRNLCV